MIDEKLRKTADYQMLHASFNPDIGLLNGRMGIILFFFHYARHTGNSAYEILTRLMILLRHING